MERIVITGELVTRTGLHVGNQEGGALPRGLDSPILQNPAKQMFETPAPFISASSLKGKLRNAAEWLFDHTGLEKIPDPDDRDNELVPRQQHMCKTPEKATACPVCFLFGTPAEAMHHFAPRVIIRNALPKEPLARLEQKAENTLPRLTGDANPRTLERIPFQTRFALKMVYLVFPGEENVKIQNIQHLLGCMLYLQDHYLGGNGTRGYGAVGFAQIELSASDVTSDPKIQPLLQKLNEESLNV